MIRYHIFLIEDEVYQDYFFRTHLLKRFFNAYMTEPNRADLKRQFRFMTCPIPTDKVDQTKHSIYVNDRIITVFLDNDLIYDPKLLKQLEKLNHHCFIIEHTNENYGWLTPRKSTLSPTRF